MKIIKATDAMVVAHPLIVIHGAPGVCKTSLAYSGVDTLLLDIDKGAHRAVNRTDTVAVDSWADVLEVTTVHPSEIAGYKTVSVDTLGRLIDAIGVAAIQEDPKNGRGGAPSQQGWGVIKSRFQGWISTLQSMGKDVCIVAHEKIERKGDLRIAVPDVAGGSYGELLKRADYIGYIHMIGNQRVIDFQPSEEWIAKGAGAWETIDVPPPHKAADFMAKLFDRARASLGNISERSAAVARAIEEWRLAIASFTKPDEINRAIPEANALVPLAALQVKRLLNSRAKALAFVFDDATKQFVAPVSAATTSPGEDGAHTVVPGREYPPSADPAPAPAQTAEAVVS